MTEYLWYNGPTSCGKEEEFKRKRGGRRVKDGKDEEVQREEPQATDPKRGDLPMTKLKLT